MRPFRVTQQEIVFVVFAALFLFCSLFLKGFLTSENILALLQNVSVLGILGLAMAIVVIGGGIDISLIAALAVPPGWSFRWCRMATRSPDRLSRLLRSRSPSVL